jgi:bile acid-coenzyme A ligase
MEKISYGRVVSALAQADPQRVAVVCGDDSITRGELDKISNQWANVFLDEGVGVGRLVTIGLPNCIEFVVACLAAWKCGAIPNPISHRLPAPEREGILALGKPALAIGVDVVPAECVSLPADFKPDSTTSQAAPPDAVSPNERAIASGGSTGRPKLILLAAEAVHDPDSPGTVLSPKGCVLVPGPMYHAAPFGSMTQAMLAGEKIVLLERFDASRCLELVEEHRVDQILFVPTMMHRIWRLPEEERTSRDVSSLRVVFTGSAPCPAWLMRSWIEWLGADVMHELYGGTERIGGTAISGHEWLEHPGSVGRPMSFTKIRILDPETGDELGPGEVGEIYMMPTGGQGSTYRYIGAKARSNPEGWESVGDLGYLDVDGYLFLADRRTDMILNGGRNIYPAQVEAAIEEFQGVTSSAVIGLADEDMGERVHAIVQASVRLDVEELREHLESRIARYSVPRSFEFVDYPLRDDAGKVRHWALREERSR